MPLTKRFKVEPYWQDKTAVIVGGGPSLSLAQIRHIAKARLGTKGGVRVIAVNDSIFVAWFADWLHACDAQWWRWNIQSAFSFQGVKTSTENTVPPAWVDGYLKSTGISGFDEDPSCVRNGGNSGYQAMHIAMHAGVKKIILVGFDMQRGRSEESHWFGEHPDKIKNRYADQMIPYFPTLVPALQERGIDVFNATPGSALTTFPFRELSEVLPI